MNLSLRARLFLALVVWIGGGAALHAMLPWGSAALIVADIVLTAGVTGYTISLRCPNCQASVILDALQSPIPMIPSQCRNCGYPLS
jgi:hypothetical protein